MQSLRSRMVRTYTYETEFRNVWSILGTAFTIVFFIIAQSYSAPIGFTIFVGVIMAVMVYQILRNPVSGIEVRSHYIRAYCAGWERRISLSDIDHVVLLRSGDGDDNLLVHHKTGKKTPIPSPCFERVDKLIPILKNLGLRVEES